MVVMRTDMRFPDTVRFVGLYIDQLLDGRSESLLDEVVETAQQPDGTRTVSLPSNFAIESNGKDDASTVRVRVVAYDPNMTPLAMRESRAAVPSDRLAAMPMPLLWMNTEELTANADPDVFVRLQSSTCGADSTLDEDGACTSIVQAELPDYVPEVPAEAGGAACNPNCFDVSACFKPEFAEDVDEDFKAARAAIGWFDDQHEKCGVPLGARGELARARSDRIEALVKNLAVAVRVAPEEGAYCTKQDPNECYIVIDGATKLSVATKSTPQGDRLWATLPAGICRKWQAGKIFRDTAVAVPGCNRKLANQTICGPNETGCTTDVGWDGTKNPRAGTGAGGTDAPAPEVCTVPEATAIWASGTGVVAMTKAGTVVSVPPSLANCQLAVSGESAGPGLYRFADAAPDRLAFMNLETGKAGTAIGAGTSYVLDVPEAVKSTDGPWGVAIARSSAQPIDIYLGPYGGWFGAQPLQLGSQVAPFTQISNGIEGIGATRFVVGVGSQLLMLEAPRGDVGGSLVRLADAAPLTATPAVVPQHAVAGTNGTLFVLTASQEQHLPGLVRFEVGSRSAPSAVQLALPTGEPPMDPILSEMPLAAGRGVFFFGDQGGRIYRITPGADASTASAAVLVRSNNPVHSVYYADIPGPSTGGFLYWVSWPDGDAARARIQRLALTADNEPYVPAPVADAGGGSSGGTVSSSSSSSGASTGSSSGSTSSGGSSTSSGGSSGGSTSSGGASSGGPLADAAIHEAGEPL